MAYLTADGFQRETLQEIRARLEQAFRDIYGPEIDLQPEGRTGHLIGLLAKSLSDCWDGGQAIYSMLDPSQAVGLALDVICSLTGVFRIAAAKTRVGVTCYVETPNDNTLIPAGRQVRRARGALVFSLRTAFTVSSSACRDLYLQLPTEPTPGDTVTLATSFGTFSVVVPSTSTPTLSTYQLLAAAVNASGWTGSAQAYPASSIPTGAQFDEECLRLVDPLYDFGLPYSADWTPALIGSVGDFECSIYGSETVDVGEISEIVTSEPGWTSAYNLATGNTGRLAETDAQLRIRREQLFGAGNATERAILGAVYNRVPGIVSASIRSNRTLSTDSDGRPGKSFEVTAQGGMEADIGKAIWDTQPAGIESYGNIVVDVTDSQGIAQTVKFTRPIPLWLWIDVRFERYNDESFPSNGETQLREQILSWADTEFSIGADVFTGRVNSAIYKVPGIGRVQVKAALTPVDTTPTFPADYSEGQLVVGGRYLAILGSSRLTITEGNFL